MDGEAIKVRKLASIQRVSELTSIEGADTIECATVLGWRVVVKKGEFKVNDLCLYCEIGSVLPKRPEFKFLESKKYLVKTIKLRGQISQGLCLPLSCIPDYTSEEILPLGLDVTDRVGVVKYDPPEIGGLCSGGIIKSKFPCYVNKTDEERLQSMPWILRNLEGIPCYITSKIDGTSATYAIKDGEISVCSRNCTLQEGSGVYWEMAEKYNILRILKAYGNLAIQGEIAGPGIQKNRLGLSERQLFVFSVYDVTMGSYYDFYTLKMFCRMNNLQMVPVITEEYYTDGKVVGDLLKLSQENKYPNGHEQEGIVVRPLRSLYGGTKGSFKVINNNYLLKTEK